MDNQLQRKFSIWAELNINAMRKDNLSMNKKESTFINFKKSLDI